MEVRKPQQTFRRFYAVDDISFSVRAGEFSAFRAPRRREEHDDPHALRFPPPRRARGERRGLDILTEQEGLMGVIGYMSQSFSLTTTLRCAEPRVLREPLRPRGGPAPRAHRVTS